MLRHEALAQRTLRHADIVPEVVRVGKGADHTSDNDTR